MINSRAEALENMRAVRYWGVEGGRSGALRNEKHGVLLGTAHRRSFLLLAFSNLPVSPIF